MITTKLHDTDETVIETTDITETAIMDETGIGNAIEIEGEDIEQGLDPHVAHLPIVLGENPNSSGSLEC